jgi:oligoendopeptidase F
MTTLPTWNLSDLYPGMDAPEIAADLETARAQAATFRAAYEGKLESLSGDAVAEAVQAYERLEELLGKLGSYAQLVFAENMTDAARSTFYQNTLEGITDISAELLFFTLTLTKLPESLVAGWIAASPTLARYKPWLDRVRSFQPYQLSDELETLLHEKSVTGSAAWCRLFDETLAGITAQVGEEILPLEQVLDRLSWEKEADRKQAAKAVGAALETHAKTFTLVTNILAKDKAIEDRWRKFARPISSRNVANQVEDEVVDALIGAVKTSYPALSHRYYKLKAKWLGQEKLNYWDRNAPLLEAGDRSFSWDEAVETVLTAYGDFSPEMRALGQQFFDNAWIDVPARAGKAPGAFAHPTVPSAHPYLLLNFQGKLRDVMTLAHELGHGVHQLLSAGQGALMADTPLTLAETASVFGEQLTFQAMLKRETNPVLKRAMLAAKVEDMLNTVVRQVAFCEFERRLHDARQEGELSLDAICDLWLAVQRESLGDAFRFDSEYRYYWSYISHFIHSPFYVYAYAFGDCLVNALYTVYAGGHPGFEGKYMEMLRAGGTLKHHDLLRPFGLDARDPAFWQRGLSTIAGFIDALEE